MTELPELVVLGETSSTNDEIIARAREGAPAFTAVRADVQTAGRGRKTHDWASPDGGLYLSILLRPNCDASMLPGLSAVCGMATIKAIRTLGCTKAALKWPNDIVAQNKKLAGILMESQVSGSDGFVVFGVGVNYKTPAVESNSIGALEPVGLEELMDYVPTLDVLATTIQQTLAEEVVAWEAGLDSATAPLSPVLQEYNELLAYRHQEVSVVPSDGSDSWSAVFEGVNGHGRAVVKKSDGSEVALESIDYSIRAKA